MENKIILIEDDEEIREMINDYLSGEFRKLKILEKLQRMLKNRVLENLFSMCVYFMLHCTKT